MLRLVRGLGFWAVLAVITPPFSLLAIATFWLPAAMRYQVTGTWCRLVVVALRLVCGVSHQVHGAANLPDSPYVICAKHQSAWETIAFIDIFPRHCFVIKRSLLLVPFFGWGLYLSMSPIPIKRDAKLSSFRSVIRAGARRFKQGFSVVVFPEGTRMPVGQSRPFLPSAFALATEHSVPVVPVALNSGRFWPKKHMGLCKSPGVIEVSIGQPIPTAGSRPRAVCAQAEEWIKAETRRLGG